MIRQTSLAAFVCVLLLTTVGATAQVVFVPVPALTVSAGYSYLKTQRSTDLFYDHSGAYVDADAAWLLPTVVPLQVGIGVTGSGYDERESTSAPVVDYNNNNYYYSDDHLYSDVGLIEVEPRIGLHLGGWHGFFAVPRVGAGLLVNSYSIDQTFTGSDGNAYISTDHHTGAAFEIRPAIQAGYSWRFVTVGVDASYMYAWGNFGGLGRNAHEYRIGAFVNFTF